MYAFRERASALKTSRSVVAVGWTRERCLLFKPPVSVSSEWKRQRHVHTMHSPQHCGDPGTHARWRRTHKGWTGTFPVFLTALDFDASASLSTTVSQSFTVSWACRFTRITFQRHSHTATTTSTSPTSQPTHGAARVSKQIRIFRQWLCFIFLLFHPLHFRKMKNPQNEIEDQIFGLVSEQSREMVPLTLLARSHCLPTPGPWWSVFSCLFGKLAFLSKRSKTKLGQRAGDGGAFYVKKNLLLSTGENPASP